MLFNIDHDELVNVELVEEVDRLPEATARQYGFTGETLDFLVNVGLPTTEEWEFSFGLPEDFKPGFIWDCAEHAEQGWRTSAGVEKFVKIGVLPISAVVVDPATGVVYQYSEGDRQVIPIHGDVSSLVKTVISFLNYVGSYNGDDDDEDNDYGYDRRSSEVQALKDEIQRIDPLPFAHEHSEWIELFDNIEAGVYT
ncbi:SUKH-4 family immunity protein [Streptomyces thermodiastaticus]|uniref:SUKH-4 family immunity protein n=1 Tax=Streptomyces thermodiastaticus TaxID=44061 RepID=UPI001673DB99|nr:SUKH-4 family immunity protein [Streptomyces thermodiastaticus]MCE7550324.1 SUKH-4 family immunity protein [Streptomyces thermodiastaticus]GHE24098.1 hypothetical protein GCM10018787_53080 [Streptomyces thermodiastaticus]